MQVPSRTADITMDTDEQETKEAAFEVEESMSLATRLEEIRKEGGDKWLAILTTDQKKVPTVCTHTHTHTLTLIHTPTHTHSHTHTHTHTLTHTHTHTHTPYYIYKYLKCLYENYCIYKCSHKHTT